MDALDHRDHNRFCADLKKGLKLLGTILIGGIPTRMNADGRVEQLRHGVWLKVASLDPLAGAMSEREYSYILRNLKTAEPDSES